ncbi:MAG: hypothetical protein VB071_11060 [Lawsonibacter sp.]|nr:hypothetical protein [Lawsonibacter sp.]
MKNVARFLILFCILFGLLSGCGAKQPAIQPNGPIQAQTVPDAQESNRDPAQTEPDTQTSTPADVELPDESQTPVKGASVDVDLTALSSTMVYAEVYNMMTNPDAYMGKTIKMSGQYTSTYLEDTKKNYFFVVISDATACCQQGIEFIWNGEHSYPKDYPEDESNIEVTGVFGSYQEKDQTYYYLAVDEIKQL